MKSLRVEGEMNGRMTWRITFAEALGQCFKPAAIVLLTGKVAVCATVCTGEGAAHRDLHENASAWGRAQS